MPSTAPRNFSTTLLEKLQLFHTKSSENILYINNLITARHTYDKKDVLIVGKLLSTISQTETNIVTLKKPVLSHPLYVNQLISADAKFTTLLIKPFFMYQSQKLTS